MTPHTLKMIMSDSSGNIIWYDNIQQLCRSLVQVVCQHAQSNFHNSYPIKVCMSQAKMCKKICKICFFKCTPEIKLGIREGRSERTGSEKTAMWRNEVTKWRYEISLVTTWNSSSQVYLVCSLKKYIQSCTTNLASCNFCTFDVSTHNHMRRKGII